MTTSSQARKILDETNALQRRAANPQASVWVSANAGTGKTHVLTQRVLRLLLDGTKPERILCLTYTKAAAAEMSSRIFEQLGKWVMSSDTDLDEHLMELTGKPATSEDRALARTLFTSAIETPGGLKVQTIHSFCERLLQRFPLEAGIAPGFATLPEAEANALIRAATDKVLVRATSNPETRLGKALLDAIAYAADDPFDDILNQALKHCDWLEDYCRLPADHTENERALAPEFLAQAFGIEPTANSDGLTHEMCELLPDHDAIAARDVLRGGSTNDHKLAATLDKVLRAKSAPDRCEQLADFFLTKEGSKGRTPRTRWITKKTASANSSLHESLCQAQSSFHDLFQKRLALTVIQATGALYEIASVVMQAYTEMKRRRSALDFDDLVRVSVTLLEGPAAAEWVLYKLDEGLSHVLVDESQDTSPEQWRLIRALSKEFFTGFGTSDTPRTVFAVGDEKQSIYSFQGAAPHEFAKQGEAFFALAVNATQAWDRVPLTLSFRTVAPILAAVDRVFADRSRTPGLTTAETQIAHHAKRVGQSGRLELWPAIGWENVEDSDPWAPLSESSSGDPVAELAGRIAETIAHWIERKDKLASSGMPIQPGDILILVRKRQPFAAAMVAALKARNIPVSGADRIDLLNQIAIQDLLSLGDFLTLPEDDLALAEVLKSPIFAFDDADLITLAAGRKRKTLWRSLLDHRQTKPLYEEAAATLMRWRKQADFAPPYEFFGRLLDSDKVRDKLLSRLGPDATDALDEFIDLALRFDEREPPSLSGFLNWIRADTHEIKRDLEMRRNEVRVMTVHGAKGLEAPIVFLPDTCAKPTAHKSKPIIKMPGVARPEITAPPFLWSVKGTSRLPQIEELRQAEYAAEQEETYRLLYVAMTRARDRLYIAGFMGRTNKVAKGSWYDAIDTALAPMCEAATDHAGRQVLRLDGEQSADLEVPKAEYDLEQAVTDRPPWVATPAPIEPQLAIPLAPSRLAPFELDEEGEPRRDQPKVNEARQPPPASPTAPADSYRFLRGNLTHALLHHLPGFAPAKWPHIAQKFVDARGDTLSGAARQSIVGEVLNVLTDPEFAPLFGPESRGEVPIVAQVPHPGAVQPDSGRGARPDLKLSGAIDRLAVTADEVFIVDYKTNRVAPDHLEEVADAYLYQLASYRLALRQIYPKHAIRAALLWTDGPRIMEIPSTILDGYEESLWKLDGQHLDA